LQPAGVLGRERREREVRERVVEDVPLEVTAVGAGERKAHEPRLFRNPRCGLRESTLNALHS
jgi:hypothetical protein